MSTTTSSDKSVDFKLYRYDPNMAATVIFIVLFATVTILHTYQLLRTRTWYFIPFVVGGYCKCNFRKFCSREALTCL